MTPSKNIEEVVAHLGEIIAHCRSSNSSIGFFASLYRRVTVRIQHGIAHKEFEDNERMERLDVIFATRFIDAYYQYKSGEIPTKSWAIAFKATENTSALAIQHLLLGINAHINLDLGIAAAETIGQNNLQDFLADFNKINSILAELLEDFQNRINKISPLFGLLDTFTKNNDELLANFSIGLARDGAWQFANTYYNTTLAERQNCIALRDDCIAVLAQNLAAPKGRWLNALIRFVGYFEQKNVTKVIAAFEE